MRTQRSKKQPNVFETLGFAPAEAEHLRVRAELLVALQENVRKRELTQSAAAKLLGVSQPRVSNLLSGQLDLFSADALIELLARVGIGVSVTLKPLRPGRVA
ncbi:MAG: XRE family transcriptional regulator [Planctomycetes bacterium]|nr:XRE family transcriptional regulator [Planctomycetota bacterium]